MHRCIVHLRKSASTFFAARTKTGQAWRKKCCRHRRWEPRAILGDEIHTTKVWPAAERKRSVRLLGTASDIGEAQSGHEATALVETAHLRVVPATLKQDMIAASRPGLRKRCLNHGSTMASSLELRMCDDVLEECVAAPSAQKIWCGNQHACCHDFSLVLRHEDGHSGTAQCVSPDLMRALGRLNKRTDVRDPKEIE